MFVQVWTFLFILFVKPFMTYMEKSLAGRTLKKQKTVNNDIIFIHNNFILCCYPKHLHDISLNNKYTRIFNLSVYFRIVLDFRVLSKCLGWRRPQSIASGHPRRMSIFIHKLNTILRSSLQLLLFADNHRSTGVGNQTVW